jgi:hypothetical protein
MTFPSCFWKSPDFPRQPHIQVKPTVKAHEESSDSAKLPAYLHDRPSCVFKFQDSVTVRASSRCSCKYPESAAIFSVISSARGWQGNCKNSGITVSR